MDGGGGASKEHEQQRSSRKWSLGLEHEFLVVEAPPPPPSSLPPSSSFVVKLLSTDDVVRVALTELRRQRARAARLRRTREAGGLREMLAGLLGGTRTGTGTGAGTLDMDAIETDFSFVEVKSTRHERATIESIVHQVRVAEELVLEAARGRSRSSAAPPRIYPYSGYTGLAEGSRVQARAPEYAGSYHVWITMPYAADWRDPEERTRLSRVHALLVHRLQWMEPLLLSILSGDPRAVGNGVEHPRASMRSAFNHLSGYGTTEPATLLHLERRHMSRDLRDRLNNRIRYFPSVEALRAAHGQLPGRPSPTHVERRERIRHALRRPLSGQSVALWVRMEASASPSHTSLRPLETCMNAGRTETTHTDEGADTFDSALRVESSDGRRLPYQEILNRRGSYYDLGRGGNDVRVAGCGRSLTYPILPGWRRAWVLSNMACNASGEEELQLVLHFFRVSRGRKGVQVRATAPTAREAEEAREEEARGARQHAAAGAEDGPPPPPPPVGFEFRMLDNFPSADALEVLRLVVLLAAGAEHDEAGRLASTDRTLAHLQDTRALMAPEWNEAMAVVSQRGSFARLPANYVQRLFSDVLHLPPPHSPSHSPPPPPPGALFATDAAAPPLPSRAYPTLLKVCRALHARYATHPVTRCMQDGTYALPPTPVNRNMEAWWLALEEKVGRRMTAGQVRAFLRARAREDDPAWEPDLAYVLGLPPRSASRKKA